MALPNRFSVSLAGLLGFTTLCALGLAALVNASPLTFLLVELFQIATFLLAAIACFHSRNTVRAFAGCFLVVSFGFTMLNTCVNNYSNSITNRGLDYLFEEVLQFEHDYETSGGFGGMGFSGAGFRVEDDPFAADPNQPEAPSKKQVDQSKFKHTGITIISLLLGFVAAFVARGICAENRSELPLAATQSGA